MSGRNELVWRVTGALATGIVLTLAVIGAVLVSGLWRWGLVVIATLFTVSAVAQLLGAAQQVTDPE